MPEIESKTHKYRLRFNTMRDEVTTEGYVPKWKDIADNMCPRKGAYLTSTERDQKPGARKDQKIINGSANDALRVIAAGLHSGLTSPARPWFRLTLADEDLAKYQPVKEWLHVVRDRMLLVMGKSNFYRSMHSIYKEMAAFGTSAMMIEEDFTTIMRCRPFTIGEFYLACDDRYRVNTLYRQYSMSTLQMIKAFGKDKVSEAVRGAHSSNNFGSRFEIIHGIQPNDGFDPDKRDVRGKKYESIYYELNSDPDMILRRAGYESRPFMTLRWDLTGINTYGDGPGDDAIGDVKMLQKLEEDKLQALDKSVKPPMNAPAAMKGKGGTIVSGGVNYIDVQQGQQGFTPTFQVDPKIREIAFEIDRVEARIRRFFFNDLFLTVLQEDKQMTAMEVAKRHEEKLLILGPVVEGTEDELDGAIERTYTIMNRFDMIPPMPREMANVPIRVEYLGLLSQAQKIVGTNSIQQYAAFVGSIALIKPEIVDKFDADEAADAFADAVGVPPKIVTSQKKVDALRAQRAQDQQMAQRMALAEPMAKAAAAAKDAGAAKAEPGSVLERMMGNV